MDIKNTEEKIENIPAPLLEFERKVAEVVSETVHGYRSERWRKSIENLERYFCSTLTKLDIAEAKISLIKSKGFDFGVNSDGSIFLLSPVEIIVPCKICGRVPTVVEYEDRSLFKVECSEFNTGHSSLFYGDTRAKAIFLWNKENSK